MATLIPSLGSCSQRMTPGERRLAQRLEAFLEDDYLLWYDVPIGEKQLHPDFLILHPDRGLFILEVKDWRLDTIAAMTRSQVTLHPNGKKVQNPLEQARTYAHHICQLLEHDPELVHPPGSPP